MKGIPWQGNLAIQAFMRQQNPADHHALLGYFTRRTFEIARKHGETRSVGTKSSRAIRRPERFVKA